MTDDLQVLTFDNVRPPRLTLDDLLAGTVRVHVFDAAENSPAPVPRPAPALETAPAAPRS